MRFPQPNASIHHLPNGLTVILDSNSQHPVVSVQLWVATGSLHEGALLGSGISHFLEHMVFKGTKNFSSEELPRVVQAHGGHWNAYTTFDRTVYYIDGPSTGTFPFLDILTDLVFQPLLPEGDFEMERDVIRREIDMGLDDPDSVGLHLLLSTAFRADARRHPVIGYRPLFDRIMHEDLIRYHASRYVPNRCHIVLSGDFDEKTVLDKIVELTANLVPGMAEEPVVPQDPPQCGMRIGKKAFAVPAAKLTMAWKAPALGDPDAPAFDVLAAMLGHGQSSPLFHELRECRELCHEISSWCWTSNQGDGLFAVSAECQMEHLSELKAGIFEIISNYAEKVSEEELAKAVRQMNVTQFRSLTSASGRASDLASNWHEARDLRFTGAYLEAANRVTLADIRRCLATLSDRTLTEILVHPEDCILDTTKALQADKHDHEEWRMTNGIKAAVFPDCRVPLVSIQVAVRGGLSADILEKAGCSGLLAATITQGTQKRSAKDLYATLDSLGSTLSARVGNNSFTLSATCVTDDLPTVMECLAEVVMSPAFDEGAIDRERSAMIASLEESLQNPLSLAFRKLRSLLFGEEGYGLPASGTSDSLAKISKKDLEAMHQRLFHAKNICIGIAGDVAPDDARRLLDQHFHVCATGMDAFTPPVSVLHQGTVFTEMLDKKQAVLCLGYPGIHATDERRHALAMLVDYCSDMAGPFFVRIREELGLAYQVGATQFHGHDTGMLTFYLATSPEQLDLAKTEMLQLLELIQKEGIPESSFESVRATVLSSLALQAQSPGATARSAAMQMIFGKPADQRHRMSQEILAVTSDDVRQIAADLLHVKPTICMVRPE